VGKATDLERREHTQDAEEGKRPQQFSSQQAADYKRGRGCGDDDAEHHPVIRRRAEQHGQSQHRGREQRHEPRQDARFRGQLQPVLQSGEWFGRERRDKETPLDLSIAKAQDLDGVSSRLSILSISCLTASCGTIADPNATQMYVGCATIVSIR